MKPLALDLPYPSTETPTKDIRSGQILSFAYASDEGELTAVLQYMYQSTVLRRDYPKLSETLSAIAVCEMLHYKLLGEAMQNCGVTPTVTKRTGGNVYDASYVSRTIDLRQILSAAMKSELEAIATYKKMLSVLHNEDIEKLVERLILDEQLHYDTLKGLTEQDL